MMKKKFALILSVFFTCCVFAQQMSMEQYLANEALLKIGEASFQSRCSGCHGAKGDAASASPLLNPKPRNFTSGTFKFRSTANGELPTDADLVRTITFGVIGTSMPGFDLVSQTEILGLVQYIKTLSPVWKERTDPRIPLNLPPIPKEMFQKRTAFLKAAEQGREIYKTSCMLCHGPAGKGDGPAAEGQTDEWDQPIKPSNLTLPHIKSGYGAEDIYRVLATGLNGTPMAAFADTLGVDNTWKIVAYIMYLRAEKAGIYNPGTIPAIEPTKDN